MIIEILWNGPFTLEEVIESKYSKKEIFGKTLPFTGLYQIYGTHPTSGKNTLLYIGMTRDQSFEKRLSDHKKSWIQYEYDDIKIYLGGLGKEVFREMEYYPKEDCLYKAENLLLYMCCPPYNSNSITDYKDFATFKEEPIVLRNYGKIGLIPPELSSNWYNSKVWEESNDWKFIE